jgi:hypothetical protein
MKKDRRVLPAGKLTMFFIVNLLSMITGLAVLLLSVSTGGK